MKLLQALLALFALAFLSLHAASLDDLTYTTTNGEVTITDCNEAATGELVIPNTIDGNPVTSIGDGAFEGCWSLISTTIGNSVTSIGEGAFNDCTILTSITIGNSVTSIGEGAFRNCRGLRVITIPDSVTSIGDYAFSSCRSLPSITIGSGVTSIGDGAFSGCSRLTSITMDGPPPSATSSSFGDEMNAAPILNVQPQWRDNYGETWYGMFVVESKEDTVSSNTTRIEAIEAQLA
ncbi:leucine-rich repeat domain-containing protein, partial [Akkermansiaceae bacterium]|nr:leucine-rich repeat domain-containing protein [Akkermansiaceae bacterium]